MPLRVTIEVFEGDPTSSTVTRGSQITTHTWDSTRDALIAKENTYGGTVISR